MSTLCGLQAHNSRKYKPHNSVRIYFKSIIIWYGNNFPELYSLYADSGSEKIRCQKKPRILWNWVKLYNVVIAVKIVLIIYFIRPTGKFDWNNCSVALKEPAVLYMYIKTTRQQKYTKWITMYSDHPMQCPGTKPTKSFYYDLRVV